MPIIIWMKIIKYVSDRIYEFIHAMIESWRWRLIAIFNLFLR